MNRISFLNGKFLPHQQCFIHIEDRGFQMADGVYEVILFKNNKLIDNSWHLDRLFRSLNELSIKIDYNKEQLTKIILELFEKNNLNEGSVYLNITRGTVARQPNFPLNYIPTINCTVSPLKKLSPILSENAIKVITHPDIRWQRCDIKSVGLIASSFVRQKAIDRGFNDAIFIREQFSEKFITEATFANVFIVDKNNNLITKNADNFILCGITRNRIINLAKQNNINVLEQKFSLEDLLNAREVFLSSTTLTICPIFMVDNQIIDNGKVGNITTKLFNLYNEFIEQEK